MKAAQNDAATEEALGKLLDGRTWDELAGEISAYWKQSGVTITFAPSGGWVGVSGRALVIAR